MLQIFSNRPNCSYLSKSRMLHVSKQTMDFYQISPNAPITLAIVSESSFQVKFERDFTNDCTYFNVNNNGVGTIDLSVYPEIDSKIGTDSFPFASGYYDITKGEKGILIFTKN